MNTDNSGGYVLIVAKLTALMDAHVFKSLVELLAPQPQPANDAVAAQLTYGAVFRELSYAVRYDLAALATDGYFVFRNLTKVVKLMEGWDPMVCCAMLRACRLVAHGRSETEAMDSVRLCGAVPPPDNTFMMRHVVVTERSIAVCPTESSGPHCRDQLTTASCGSRSTLAAAQMDWSTRSQFFETGCACAAGSSSFWHRRMHSSSRSRRGSSQQTRLHPTLS